MLEMPFDKELEEMIIGNVLLMKRMTVEDKKVSVTDFYSLRNQKIWQVMCEMDEDGTSIEIFDVHAKLDDEIKVTELANMTMGLLGDTRSEDVKRLKDLATLRNLIRNFSKMARMAEKRASVEEILTENASMLDQVRSEQEKRHGTSQHIIEVMEYEVFPRLDKFVSGDLVKIPFGFDKLDDSCNGGASLGELVLFGALPKSGKALALDTKIPTPQGWTTMGDIQVGDQVFDEQGNICNVVAATPVMHGRPCFELELNNKVRIIADAQHEWVTRTAAQRQSDATLLKRSQSVNYMQSPFSRDMAHRRVKSQATVTTDEIAQKVRLSDGKVNHYIKTAAPLQMCAVDLPVTPYVLGAWLGDGTSVSGGFTTADQNVLSQIHQFGYATSKQKSQYAHTILGLKAQLRELGVLGNKHIPHNYLRSSTEQRIALLQGLMDTDGYCCPKKGICEFTNTNQRLVIDVLELLGTLGINAKLYTGDASLHGRITGRKWRISFQTDLSVFRLERKRVRQASCKFKGSWQWRGIKRVEPIQSVPVRCIQVDSPSNMYLITDRFIPTHNSCLALQIARNIAQKDIPAMIVSREMLNYENGFRFIAQSSDYSVNVFRSDMHELTAHRLKEHAQAQYNIPLYLDSQSRTLKDISREVQRRKEEDNLTAVFVDYIQLVHSENSRASRAEKLEEIVYGLKDLAVKHEIVVYANAQFNREGIKSERPTLAHFDGSSAIEKAANLALLWTLEKDYNYDLNGRKGQMWIEAGRSVANDEFDIVFHGKTSRFSFL